MLQLLGAYVVMLMMMTYDSRILITVMAGALLGYFLADPLIAQGMESIYLKNIERQRVLQNIKAQSDHGGLLQKQAVDIGDN